VVEGVATRDYLFSSLVLADYVGSLALSAALFLFSMVCVFLMYDLACTPLVRYVPVRNPRELSTYSIVEYFITLFHLHLRFIDHFFISPSSSVDFFLTHTVDDLFLSQHCRPFPFFTTYDSFPSPRVASFTLLCQQFP